jgi:hypothetical protein
MVHLMFVPLIRVISTRNLFDVAAAVVNSNVCDMDDIVWTCL